MAVFEIPTLPGRPFTERVSLAGVTYTLNFHWNPSSRAWVVDLYDRSGQVAVLTGIQLVTGADLLEQFAYLPVGANAIWTVLTRGPGKSPDEIPDFQELGIDGHLYVTTP